MTKKEILQELIDDCARNENLTGVFSRESKIIADYLIESGVVLQPRTEDAAGHVQTGLDEYTLDRVSQFLNDTGFTDASKAVDCHYDL